MGGGHRKSRAGHHARVMFARQKTRAQGAESDDIDSLPGAISPKGLGCFAHREILVVLQPRETLAALGVLVSERGLKFLQRAIADAQSSRESALHQGIERRAH